MLESKRETPLNKLKRKIKTLPRTAVWPVSMRQTPTVATMDTTTTTTSHTVMRWISLLLTSKFSSRVIMAITETASERPFCEASEIRSPRPRALQRRLAAMLPPWPRCNSRCSRWSSCSQLAGPMQLSTRMSPRIWMLSNRITSLRSQPKFPYHK